MKMINVYIMNYLWNSINQTGLLWSSTGSLHMMHSVIYLQKNTKWGLMNEVPTSYYLPTWANFELLFKIMHS